MFAISDAAWFLSASIQTIGALVGVFLILYVFLVKDVIDVMRLGYQPTQQAVKLLKLATKQFAPIFVILSVITIILNGWVLYSINRLDPSFFNFWYPIGFGCFVTTILFFGGFSIGIFWLVYRDLKPLLFKE